MSGLVGANRTVDQADQAAQPDGQWDETEESHRRRRELEEQGRRRGGDADEDDETHHLSRGDPVGPVQRCTGHQRGGHDGVVDVGADEGGGRNADVGPKTGGGQECGQVAGSGIAGPKGLSPCRVTRCA